MILNGKECEMARSRYISDSLNPTWDETFECILPMVESLEVMSYSKNILADDSRLHQKLEDQQTHDTYLELEPQGRILIRLTLEGGDEDVDFWFRRSRERLGRTRDVYVRALTAKVYIRFSSIDLLPLDLSACSSC